MTSRFLFDFYWRCSRILKFRPQLPSRLPLRQVTWQGRGHGKNAQSIWQLVATMDTSRLIFDFGSNRACSPGEISNVSTTVGLKSEDEKVWKVEVDMFWMHTSSEECFDQAKLQTCEPVSMHCMGWFVSVFQNRIQRSAVPPPLAKSPWWCGDHAMAVRS